MKNTNLIEALEKAKNTNGSTIELVVGKFQFGWQMWTWLNGKWVYEHPVYGSTGLSKSDQEFESWMIELVEEQGVWGSEYQPMIAWTEGRDYTFVAERITEII